MDLFPLSVFTTLIHYCFIKQLVNEHSTFHIWFLYYTHSNIQFNLCIFVFVLSLSTTKTFHHLGHSLDYSCSCLSHHNIPVRFVCVAEAASTITCYPQLHVICLSHHNTPVRFVCVAEAAVHDCTLSMIIHYLSGPPSAPWSRALCTRYRPTGGGTIPALVSSGPGNGQ